MNGRLKTKDICMLGIGVALYVVVSAMLKIPLIGHIQTDLDYIVFGVYCALYGPWASVVGTVGCLFVSLIFSGWLPIGWMLGQFMIGIICGTVYKSYTKDIRKTRNPKLCTIAIILWTVFAIWFGIVFIKTAVECILYQIPVPVKVMKNLIAAIADLPPMLIGIYI